MMHRRYHIYICVLILPVLSGCLLLPPEARDLRKDIYDIKVQVGRLQTLQGDTHKLLSSEIEEARQRQKAESAASHARLHALEQKVITLTDEVRELRALVEELRYGLKQGSGNVHSSGSSGLSGNGIRDVTVSEDGQTIDGDALLKSANLSFTKGKYEKARDSLERYLRHFSSSPRAAEAMALLADTHYYQKNYDAALKHFLQLADSYPAAKQVPDSLVKAAVCQVNLGRSKDAATTLKRVLRDFPRYQDIARVKTMLRNLEQK